jgi:hypothetical protein
MNKIQVSLQLAAQENCCFSFFQDIIRITTKMLLRIFKFLLCWILAAIYSTFVIIFIGLLFIFKWNTKFWKIKSRPLPPKILTSDEFGEHKFAEINVSKIYR